MHLDRMTTCQKTSFWMFTICVSHTRMPQLTALGLRRSWKSMSDFTGRPVRGVLIAVVGRERMLEENYLDMTKQGVKLCNRKVELQLYSCEQVGVSPWRGQYRDVCLGPKERIFGRWCN